MTSPPQSQDLEPDFTALQQEQSSQIENSISIDVEHNQQHEHKSPQTLETSRNHDSEKSDPNLGETQVVVEQEEEESPGTVIKRKTPNRRNVNKRKKAHEYKKKQAIDKKVQNLLESGAFVSFIPSKILDFEKHEHLFKRLGLWDFVHIEFDESIKANLISQLIVSYDINKKCCFVNGYRLLINRTNFARALKLPLPSKKDKGVGSAVEAAIDLDLDLVWEKASKDSVAFVEDFVRSWVLLHGDVWDMPNEIRIWMGFIKDGQPEKVDWAGLFWVMVEKELKQKDQLRTCYYTSHLQYFIKSQHKELFEGDGEKVMANEEMKEEGKLLSEDDNKHAEGVEIKKDEDWLLEESYKVDEKEVAKDKDLLREMPHEVEEDGDLFRERPHEVEENGDLLRERLHEVDEDLLRERPNEVEVVENNEVEVELEEVKEDVDGSFSDFSKEEDIVVLEESNIELTFGQQDITEKEDINDDDMMDVEECNEKNQDLWSLARNDHGSKHFLQPCSFGEGRGLDGNGEGTHEVEKLEIQEAEQMKEVERIQEGEQMEEAVHIQEGEQMEEVVHVQEGEQMEEEEHIQEEEQLEEAENILKWEHEDSDEVEYSDEVEDSDEMGEQLEVEDEEDEDEELEYGIEHNIAPNYGSPEGADLTGNLLQGFETAHLQGQQFHENSSMELFASNAETHLISPSMLGNNHKRAIDYEQDTSHLNESKRIRTDAGCDQKTSDYGFCISQAGQFLEKAKIIYEEKEQAFNQVNMNHQYLLGELQQRDSIIEILQRNRSEELQNKDREIYRLERELGLLGELVNGYREALKENKRVFLEYRQRFQLPEEPIYKDAGPGGLVLSITELEKQRQQQENEDSLKRLMIVRKYNEALQGYDNQFDILFSKVQMIDLLRLTPIENEVKLLKELYVAKRKASEKKDRVPTETILPSA